MGMLKNCVQNVRKALACAFVASLVSCGVSTPDSEIKVVGGSFVKEDSLIAKHTVALLDNKLQAFCTGSLINDEFILTAAHCVGGKGKTNLKYIGFHVDFHDMSTKTRVEVIKNKIRRVADVYQHRDFEMDAQIFGPKYILTEDAVDDIALILSLIHISEPTRPY